MIAFLLISCNEQKGTTAESAPAKDSVADNIKMYMHTWDEIINIRKPDIFNDSNFTKDVVMHASPKNAVEH
jgi:hypothetical protein